MSASQTILVVEDEQAIRELVGSILEVSGYNVLQAMNTNAAQTLIDKQCPDLLLLDWMLPGETGLNYVKRLRGNDVTSQLPIIMITAMDDENNKVQGLEYGVDDYITKPFAPRELVARIKAVLRRSSSEESQGLLQSIDLVLDTSSQRVTCANQPINLGPTEYRLLYFFMTHQDRVYSREQLLDQVWGNAVYVEDRTVDVHIRRLRKAIGESHSHLIQTVRGTGYRFSITQ